MNERRRRMTAFLTAGVLLTMLAGAARAQIFATGGDATNSVGGYRIHTFTNVGAHTFQVVSGSGQLEYLVVAGGGGGGGNGGGGGGAGGVLTGKVFIAASGGPETDGVYPVAVGDGGAGDSIANGNRKDGATGGNSSFYDLIAYGGGGGCAGGTSPTSQNGRPGGSGGGASAYTSTASGTGGAATNGQGRVGGDAPSSSANGFRSSGGGGAGGPGQASTGNSAGGVGGDGIATYITGEERVLASGGSGYFQSAATPGGGGADGFDGDPNTGGGGGRGKKGGSGIVIVRYPLGPPAIENRSATNITANSAWLNSYLTTTGAAPVTVSVYWGTTDGGDPTSGLWQATNTWAEGAWTEESSPTFQVTSLTENIPYYYRFYATNAYGHDWAAESETFMARDGVVATGGQIINDFMDYRIHTFTSVGTQTLEVKTGGLIDVLVVAGGGGGGGTVGGGGGGGGVIFSNAFEATEDSFTVVVGGGGAGGATGGRGDDSAFEDWIAIGGGGGAGYNSAVSHTGGSAGGNGAAGGARGGYTVGQGHDGGAGRTYDAGGGGGGGGQAGGAGAAGGALVGGKGGDGFQSDISGVLTNYAGGGGGGGRTSAGSTVGGAGGLGGGGAGGHSTVGTNGVPNTGGGGGGGGWDGSAKNGGAGGSGIVIVRYQYLKMGVQAHPVGEVGFTNAVLNGRVTGLGGPSNPELFFCLDHEDRGSASTGAWMRVIGIGSSWGLGDTFDTSLTDLLPGSNYVYRVFAVNSIGAQAWSDTETFATLSADGPEATGGNITRDYMDYRIHYFTSVGQQPLDVSSGGMVEVLIVGGGGGGGQQVGGGGGGGGVIYTNGFAAVAGTYTVTVGGGGAGGSGAGAKGGDSAFGDLVAIGGGGGAGYTSTVFHDGGSAGGNGASSGVRGGYTPGQGHDGGNGNKFNAGGGGGGAGQTGGAGSASVAGKGGDGFPSDISGDSTHYAGGGGGGGWNTTGGAAGQGSTGAGGSNAVGVAGTANTGGGGGGGGYNNYNGGAGGTGIVIVRYPNPMLNVEARPATGIGLTNAVLHGRVVGLGEGENPGVFFCLDHEEQGDASTGAWMRVISMGASWGLGDSFDTSLTDLLPNSNYVYRVFATNNLGAQAWSETEPFAMFDKPTVVQHGATEVLKYSAILRGEVTDTGREVPVAGFDWWPEGGSVTTVELGYQDGAFEVPLAGLMADKTHYFIAWASNVIGGRAESNVGQFNTQVGGERSYTWTGANDSNWFTFGNWKDAGETPGRPEIGDTAIINSGSVLLTGETPELAVFEMTGAILTLSNWTTRLRAETVVIKNGGKLTVPAAFGNAGPSNRVWIVCSNLFLRAGGQIDAAARGFGTPAALGTGYGPGGGSGHSSGSGGGGYGGAGGNGAGGTVGGGAYPSENTPFAPGSGGGSYNASNRGGAGGGSVLIEAAGAVILEGSGTITADGGNATTTSRSGGGSGGSIHIFCASFTGGDDAVLTAAGGNGCLGETNGGGGGGGGRIAVWAGVPEAAQADYLDGENSYGVVRDTKAKFYTGDFTADGGDGSVNEGQTGSAWFFKPKPELGTMLMFR